MDEQTAYDPERYPRVAVAVDVVVLTIHEDALRVLVVNRRANPFRDQWALPGTFLRPDETAEAAAQRAASSKAGILVRYAEQLRTYTNPDRDPRMRVVSVGYVWFGGLDVDPSNDEVAWWPVFLSKPAMAFDHNVILQDAIRRAQDKLEYTTLAASFLHTEFTMGDLLSVYETVWNQKIDKGNFYRKVRASKGFVEPTGTFRGKAALYRAGDAKLLYPPIRREVRS